MKKEFILKEFEYLQYKDNTKDNFIKKDIQIPVIPSLVLGFFIEYFFNLEHFIKAF